MELFEVVLISGIVAVVCFAVAGGIVMWSFLRRGK